MPAVLADNRQEDEQHWALNSVACIVRSHPEPRSDPKVQEVLVEAQSEAVLLVAGYMVPDTVRDT